MSIGLAQRLGLYMRMAIGAVTNLYEKTPGHVRCVAHLLPAKQMKGRVTGLVSVRLGGLVLLRR
jgi:hypothetical protein